MTNKIIKEKVPDEILALCAMDAVLKTEGVFDLAGGFTESISKNLLGRELLAKGIKVSEDKEGIVIDVHINVKFNVKIPIVAWDVQENVKKDLEQITGQSIYQVNIHVQGVGFDEDDEAKKGTI
ncbi:MAG: Asp23/Gls24 family envelope stress response protein [Clostridia bacterium]|nr:Asp23/Gls24 family envelope stress response protein [Clostridia bacterium]